MVSVGWDGAERRRRKRHAVLTTGKVTFGDWLLDCLVVDVSATGARVQFGTAQALPQHVMLQLPSGARHRAQPRWMRGFKAGFSFQGGPRLSDPAAIALARAHDSVRAISLEETLGLLRVNRYLEDPELQGAAERAELGIRELESALAARLRGH